ncbi:MAG: LacI family DNA-binding transcriptional regulator [Spirochaetes bacterium]|nr:LacI family DNA-binding transcriptional regulator [Spirochaetota bacterium]
MKKRPTIKDIAKTAGVTHSTVSRVINNNPVISDETKEKVLKIMKDMDYQPNLIARGLVRQKTNTFALITPILDPHVLPLIKGVEASCKNHNYALMLLSTDYWADESQSCLQVVENWLVDGILILNDVYYKDIPSPIKKLQNKKMPFVFINKYLGTKEINTVAIDNYDAVYKVISHLFKLGHKRIGTITGGLIAVDGVERFEGYKLALKKFNLNYDENLVGHGGFGENEAYDEMKRILYTSSQPPTAMFCANDLMAIGAIRAIQEKGLKVPDDIAVAGYDDIKAGHYFKPSLTTVRPPLEDIGIKAVMLLTEIVKNPEREIEEIVLQARLIVRESSGA